MSKGTCKSEGCAKDVRAKGYCDRHYRSWRRGEMPKPRYNTCHAEGCRKPRSRRGLCDEHYAKEYAKKAGTEAPAPAAPAAAAGGDAS
jgi:hypothetical protein